MALPKPDCEACGAPGVASVNGHGMCADKEHIERVMGMAMSAIRAVVSKGGQVFAYERKSKSDEPSDHQ